MVAIASAGQGFVICLTNDNNSENTNGFNIPLSDENKLWGSWVEIINFDQDEEGILEIDVQCKSLVAIDLLEQDRDNLDFGNVFQIEHWSQQHDDNSISELSVSLESVFAENENLNDLYPNKLLNDTHWVLARWLEILPIEINVKSAFVDNYSFQEAKGFVESVIFK